MFIGVCAVGFPIKFYFDQPGVQDQFLYLLICQKGRLTGLFIITGFVRAVIIVSGSIRSLFHYLVPGSFPADNDRFVEDALRVGGEQHAGEIRFHHLLYDDMHGECGGIKVVHFTIGNIFRGSRVCKHIPDAYTDIFSGDPQKSPELPREGITGRVFQRGAGADGERVGVREVCGKIVKDFLFAKSVIHTEKRRHREVGFSQQKEVACLGADGSFSVIFRADDHKCSPFLYTGTGFNNTFTSFISLRISDKPVSSVTSAIPEYKYTAPPFPQWQTGWDLS